MALVNCDKCGGTGYLEDSNGNPDVVCPKCNGNRRIDDSRLD